MHICKTLSELGVASNCPGRVPYHSATYVCHRSDSMMKRIGFLLPPGFQVLHLMAGTVYELANGLAGEDCYAVSLLS
jgi:hypothetical protein